MIDHITSKKIIIIFLICILGVIIINVLIMHGKSKFINQPKDNLEKIIVILEPYYLGQNKSFYINERSKMEHVYDLLSNTTKFRTNKHPHYLEAVQWDSDISIHFEYCNGAQDDFFLKKKAGLYIF